MDAKKLGQFIATIRKEKNMTQADLAQKLQVTDKAVSKWERGLGLPDINTIEPLAEALDVSIIEIMRSERIPDEQISQENASEAITDAFDLVKHQRRQERKHMAIIAVGTLAAVLFFLLGDTLGWMGVVGVVVPCVCIALAISLFIYGICRKRNKLPCMQSFILAGVFITIPLLFLILLFIAGIIGLGPIPS